MINQDIQHAYNVLVANMRVKRRPLFQPKDLVVQFKQVLLVLLGGRTTVNNIYRTIVQTGLPGMAYKGKMLSAIKCLEKGGFVVDVSGRKRFQSGKEQPMELTKIGRELAELIDRVDRYYVSFSELTNTIGKKFDVPYIASIVGSKLEQSEIPVTAIEKIDEQKSPVLRNILHHRGWPDETIDRFGEIFHKTLALRHNLSPEVVFRIVIMRYISVILKSSLDNEKNEMLKKDILNEIIANTISDHLSFIFKEMDKYNTLLQRNRIEAQIRTDLAIDKLIEGAFSETMALLTVDERLDNIFIEKEAMDVLASVLSISKPSPQYVDHEISHAKEMMEFYEASNHKSDGVSSSMRQERLLLTLFEEYAGKNKRSPSTSSAS